jgi:hypothetical protein
VKCQECRPHLHPYLDGELGVEKSLGILEHLNACPACRELFDGEQAGGERLRRLLGAECAPPGLRNSLLAALAQRERRRTWWRVGVVASPLAAAAAVVLFLTLRDPGAGDMRHHTHGPGIRFAIEDHAAARSSAIISSGFLELHGEKYRKLRGDELESFFVEVFGPEASIPPSLMEGESWGVPRQVSFQGTPVSNLMLDLQDQEVDVYRMRRAAAALADLHLVEDGVTEGLRIERCRACKVVAVTRGDEVFILVTRGADVDPLIALMRQTF